MHPTVNILTFLECVSLRIRYAAVTNTPTSNCPKIAKSCFSLVLQVLCELARSLLYLVPTQRHWLMEQNIESRTSNAAVAIKKELSELLVSPSRFCTLLPSIT